MPSAERLPRSAALLLACLLSGWLGGCGGGNSTETTLVGPGVGSGGGATGTVVTLDQPQGSNTTEIVVDAGPVTGFSTGVANLPYVTVKVCAPGSATACATIDHVFLDTGSIGLRLLRSTVAALGLPAVTRGSSTVVACYPFVIGAVWGAMATADVQIGGETASALPIQVIDDRNPAQPAATANCRAAANGSLLASVTQLQAKGVLGVGMLRYDCGLICEQGDYSGGYTLYYTCDAAGSCSASAVAAEQQVQNPVSQFAVNNNGTIVMLPAVPEGGAAVARGRLVFGIGTQANNQPPAPGRVLHVQTDPARDDYLYINTRTGGQDYAFSYIDSGSNGYFFNDPTLSTRCIAAGAGSNWYCPVGLQARTAELSDSLGAKLTADFAIANTDLLFASANTAFGNLGGVAGGANPGTFVWGLSFFYGRSVYTAIWGQALALNGPWFAF